MVVTPHGFAGDERVTFQHCLSREEVETLTRNPKLKTLQCSEPVDMETWGLLNEEFFPQCPDVELRVFGFYGLVCDLSFTASMTNVRRFSADCLHQAVGIKSVAAMEHLETLGVGIYDLRDYAFLNDVAPTLKGLFLGGTESKRPDLSPLSRFCGLEAVSLDGHQKNIEVLSGLTELRDVRLRSIRTAGLDYLRPLEKMWSLDIVLGGIQDLSALESMGGIKYLELCMVRGLLDLEVISSLTGLESLSLQALSHVSALPPLNNLHRLRRISLDTMKGLKDVAILEYAPALEEFIHVCARNFEPKDFLPVLRNKTLREALVGFGSDKKNARFAALMQQYGIQPWKYRAFQFSDEFSQPPCR